MLWECFVRIKWGQEDWWVHIIKKIQDLWDEYGPRERKVPSLLSQLKSIENGSLSVMEREEIRKMVSDESRSTDSRGQKWMGIDLAEWDALFGESDDEVEFMSFRERSCQELVVKKLDIWKSLQELEMLRVPRKALGWMRLE